MTEQLATKRKAEFGEISVAITADPSDLKTGLKEASEAVGATARKIDTQTKKASASLGKMGRNAGMAGIQIQQFVGQVTTGTSAMTALSQQAADLGFVLGVPLAGAIISIAAALAGPLLSAMRDVTDESKSLQINTEEWVEAFKQRLKEAGSDQVSFTSVIQSEFNKLNFEYDQNLEKIADLERRSKTMEGRGVRLGFEIKALTDRNKELAAAMETVNRISQEGLATTALDEEQTRAAEERAGRFADSLRMQTEALRYNLQLRAEIESGAISEQQAREAMRYRAQTELAELRFQEELARLGENETLKAELQAEHDAMAEQAASLHADNMINIKRDQAEREMQLQRMKQNAEISAMTSFASSAIGVMSAFGKKSFKVQKMFAIADSIVNIAGGVAKALNHPYPANLGFAAQVAAQGAALISTIKSAKPGSGSAPRAGGGAAAPAAPEQQAPQVGRTVNIRLAGSMFSPDQIRELIGQINEEIGDGAELNIGAA